MTTPNHEAQSRIRALYSAGLLRRGDVDSVRDLLMALGGILQQGIRRGDDRAIDCLIHAASEFTRQIEKAYESYPEIVQRTTHQLETLPVLVDPRSVREESKEFPKFKKYVLALAGGRGSTNPHTENSEKHWLPIATQALEALEMARTTGVASSSTFWNALIQEEVKELGHFLDLEAVRKLPPLTNETMSLWWQQAKIYIQRTWEANPHEKEKVLKAVLTGEKEVLDGDSKRTAVPPKKPLQFALSHKIYDAFRSLVRAKTKRSGS